MTAPSEDPGSSSAPGEVTSEIRIPLPVWWQSRWSLIAALVGVLLAGAGAGVAWAKSIQGQTDKLKKRANWSDWTLYRVAEKVGVDDIKPPPRPED